MEKTMEHEMETVFIPRVLVPHPCLDTVAFFHYRGGGALDFFENP